MSSDSLVQLQEARSLHFSDWHPPAMAAVWSIADAIVAGPFGMLLLQASLLLAGLYRLLARVCEPRIAAFVASGLFLFPPVLAPMAVIWKDSLMAGLLVMGTSLLVDDKRRLALALLVAASAMRFNACFAVLPLLVVLWPGQRGLRRVAIAFTLWLATTTTAFGINRVLTDAPAHAWTRSLAPGDIAGVIRFSHYRYTNAELLQILDGTPLVVRDELERHVRRWYTPVSWWPVTNGDNRIMNWPETPHYDAITRAWCTLVSENPRAYLLHRSRVFREVLGLSDGPAFDPAWRYHANHDALHVDASSGRVQAALGHAIGWLAEHTPLFRPYVYFVLALVLLWFARRDRLVRALLASGLCYELTLFVLAPSPDFRYSHWLVVCALLATAMTAARSRCRARKLC